MGRSHAGGGGPTRLPPVALVPTLLAILIGVGLGIRWGGRIDHLLGWRPVLPTALAVGLAAQFLTDLVGVGGGFGSFLAIVSLGSLLAFAVLNVRTGGMVLVALGLALDLLVTLLNWGTPVSRSALESAGALDEGATGTVVLSGGRKLADGSFLGFLGDVIPLPWGQVVSIGSILTLLGLVLVSASVVRRYEVGGGPRRPVRGGSFQRGPRDYRTALDALGRGPAPRRGPGLHPSRLEERRPAAPRRPAQRRPASGRPSAARRPGPRPR